MSLNLPKYSAGTKNVTIRDPVFFRGLLDNLYSPHIKPLKIAKDDVVMYTLQVRDNSNGRILDVALELPQSMTNTIKLTTSENGEAGLIPTWETNDSTSDQFKQDFNTLLHYWLAKIQVACPFHENGVPTIFNLQTQCELKWPWKNTSSSDYFSKFKPESNVHVLRLGVAYYNPEKNFIGVTLQLSSYPGKTLSAVNTARQTRKRARNEPEIKEHVEETKEIIVEDEDITDIELIE